MASNASSPLLATVANAVTMATTMTADGSAEELRNIMEVLTVIRLICMKIYPPFICLFGIVANVLNIIVLTRRWMASSTNVYLTAVAIVDMLYLSLFYLYSLYIYMPMRSVPWYNQLFPYIRSTANVCSNTTTWLTVTFTVERYIAVCHPMLRHKICTKERAQWIVAIVCLVCFAITMPDYLLFIVIAPDGINSTVYLHDKSALALVLSRYGYSYVNQVFFIVIPLALLIIFNTLLVRSVIKASKFRKGMLQATTVDTCRGAPGSHQARKHRPNSEQQRITLMLIVVVITFIVLQLPSTISMIVDSLHTTKKLYLSPVDEKKLLIFGNFVNIFLLTSAALNFVLYSLFSAKFRETFLRLFPCCCCTKRTRERPSFTGNGSTTIAQCESLPLSTVVSPRNQRSGMINNHKKHNHGYQTKQPMQQCDDMAAASRMVHIEEDDTWEAGISSGVDTEASLELSNSLRGSGRRSFR